VGKSYICQDESPDIQTCTMKIFERICNSIISLVFIITSCTTKSNDRTKQDIAINDSVDVLLGTASECMRDYGAAIDECLAYCNKAIELNPRSIWSYYVRGSKYESAGLLGMKGPYDDLKVEDYCKAAIEDFNMVISLCPKDFHRVKMGYSRTESLNVDYDFKRLVGEVYSSRASCNEHLGNREEAVNDYTHAIEMGYSSYDRRASLKFDLGDYRGAIQDYNIVIEDLVEQKDITDSQRYYLGMYYNNRGIAKINMGDVEGGCLDCSKAGELGNSFAYKSINKYCN